MPCRKGTAGGNASLCFWVGFARLACPWRLRYTFFGGFFSGDDVAYEKSGPAEGVGSCCVLGRRPSSILICMLISIVDLESEINPDLGFSNQCRYTRAYRLSILDSTSMFTWVLKKFFQLLVGSYTRVLIAVHGVYARVTGSDCESTNF